MPNWCSNSFKVSGSKEEIDSFENFLNEKDGKGWFDFFVKPADEKNADWYSYNLENYGCKWNCDAQDWHRSENTIEFWFDSPWGPPTKLYDFIQESGMIVEAEYMEEGMRFVGEYVDGIDDTYEYQEETDLEEIPEHLVENWNLRDQFEPWEDEWNSDDDTEFEDEEDEKNGKSNS